MPKKPTHDNSLINALKKLPEDFSLKMAQTSAMNPWNNQSQTNDETEELNNLGTNVKTINEGVVKLVRGMDRVITLLSKPLKFTQLATPASINSVKSGWVGALIAGGLIDRFGRGAAANDVSQAGSVAQMVLRHPNNSAVTAADVSSWRNLPIPTASNPLNLPPHQLPPGVLSHILHGGGQAGHPASSSGHSYFSSFSLSWPSANIPTNNADADVQLGRPEKMGPWPKGKNTKFPKIRKPTIFVPKTWMKDELDQGFMQQMMGDDTGAFNLTRAWQLLQGAGRGAWNFLAGTGNQRRAVPPWVGQAGAWIGRGLLAGGRGVVNMGRNAVGFLRNILTPTTNQRLRFNAWNQGNLRDNRGRKVNGNNWADAIATIITGAPIPPIAKVAIAIGAAAAGFVLAADKMTKAVLDSNRKFAPWNAGIANAMIGYDVAAFERKIKVGQLVQNSAIASFKYDQMVEDNRLGWTASKQNARNLWSIFTSSMKFGGSSFEKWFNQGFYDTLDWTTDNRGSRAAVAATGKLLSGGLYSHIAGLLNPAFLGAGLVHTLFSSISSGWDAWKQKPEQGWNSPWASWASSNAQGPLLPPLPLPD